MVQHRSYGTKTARDNTEQIWDKQAVQENKGLHRTRLEIQDKHGTAQDITGQKQHSTLRDKQ